MKVTVSYGDKNGQLNKRDDVTFLNDDEILVADQCNHRIQQLNVHTKLCEKLWKKGKWRWRV